MQKVIYLGPKDVKTVWHNKGEDANGSPFKFPKGKEIEVPDSLANTLDTAPNFRICDGTVFMRDPLLKSMHDEGRPISILLIRNLGGIGDILMVTPTILGVREKFPNAKIVFAINKGYAGGALFDCIETNPYIDEIIDHKEVTRAVKETFTSWINLSHPCARYEAYTIPNVDKHRAEIYADECGVRPSDMRSFLQLTPEDEAFGMEWFSAKDLHDECVVAMQPFAADRRRVIGAQKMIDVAKLCPDMTFLWVDYFDRLDNYEHPDNMIDVGEFKIRQLAAIIKRCNLAVGNDSFMLQVACAMKTPLVAIFGPTDPYMRCKFHDFWTPIWNIDACELAPCWYGYPCLDRLKNLFQAAYFEKRHEHELVRRSCLETVTPEQVVAKINFMLNADDQTKSALKQSLLRYVPRNDRQTLLSTMENGAANA